MKKEAADALKNEFYNDMTDSEPLNYMSKEVLQDSTQLLFFLEKYLEREISDYSLDESYDLIDTEEGNLIRVIWFSRGMEDTFICLSPLGEIKAIDGEFPKGLLTQVATALEDIAAM